MMKAIRIAFSAAVLTWILAFAYLQFSLLPNLRGCLLEKGGATLSAVKLPSLLSSCTDAALIYSAIILAILSVAVALFLWKGCFAGIYDYLKEKRKEWLIVAGVAALAALPYLSRGNVVLGDAMQFSALSTFMKQALTASVYPFWTFYWYMGSAPLAFYGWLHFLVAGAMNIFINIDAANKIIFFLTHIGSALLAYKLIRTATNSSKAAIVGALVYGLSFEHIARIMIGRSITSLTYFLTPMLFLLFELRLGNKLGKHKAIALIAAVAALLIFNHQADALLIAAVFVIYAALRIFESRRTSLKPLLSEIAAALILSLAIVSFWAVPMLIESSEASATGKLVEIFIPKMPDATMIKDMALWPGMFGDKPMFYLGLSSLLLGTIGTYYLVKSRKFAAAAATPVTLALLLAQSTRYAPVFLMMLAISAGYGFVFLSGKLRIDSRKLLLIIGLVMIIDLVPATFQLGYPDFSYNKSFYDTINASDGERILDLSTDRRTFWPSYAYINNGAETVFGTLIESAPRSLPYAAAIAENAAKEFYDLNRNFSEETLQGIHLLGVRYVILHNEQVGKSATEVFAGKRGALGLERGLEAIQLKSSVVIAAAKKAKITYEPLLENEEGWKIRTEFEQRSINFSEVREILDLMRLDTGKSTAKQILVKDGENENATENENLTIQVSSVRTTLDKVEIGYAVNDAAFLQLSYSYSPYLSVKVDGKETKYWKTAINTIAVRTEKGQHTVTIEAKQSQLRKNMFLMSAAGIIIMAYLLKKKQ